MQRLLQTPVAREALGALACALVPLWLFAGPVGPFRAPGLEGAGLYGQLFAGATVRRGWHGEGWGEWWPVSPLAALLQAANPIDPAWALGLVVAFGVWLAGYGPWRLARVRFGGDDHRALAAALLAALAAQTSPVVLRAIPGVELAALAVGPIALGFAHPRLAWIAGLWSAPGALTFAAAGLVRRRLPWIVAGLPALALFGPPSSLPAAMVPAAPRIATAPAYVTEGGATFPLPPAEQAPIRQAAELTRTGLWIPAEVAPSVRGNLFVGPPPTPGTGRPPAAPPPLAGEVAPKAPEGEFRPPEGEFRPTTPQTAGATPAPPPLVGEVAPKAPEGEFRPQGMNPTVASEGDRPWFGALLVPLQRVHGGLAALLGALVLVATPRYRAAGAATLAALFGLTIVFGWQDAPGEAERDATARAALYLLFDAGTLARLPGGGALAWAALLPAVGALGVAAFVHHASRAWQQNVALGAGLLLAVVGIPLENPRMVSPVAAVPPDPVREALTTLPAGRLLLFPAPQFPYLQGQRPAAALAWEAALARQTIEAEGGDPAAASLIGALTALSGAPVDTAAAELIWSSSTTEPLRTAHTAGWQYLLVDLDALPPMGRPRLDGWLAQRAGMPVARDGSRLLYDLSKGPAAADHP